MKRNLMLLSAALILFAAVPPALALPALFDWNFFVDGATYLYGDGDAMPVTGALDANGLGSLNWTTDIAGDHTFIAMFDFEIDETINTYYNEYGAASGDVADGQSWEIDEPGYVFGNIYDNVVLYGDLDNTNGVAGLEDDVSFAIGWDFTLAAGQTATIDLVLSQVAPALSFYLGHFDPDSGDSVFFGGSLDITGGAQPPLAPVPEPATIFLFGSGLTGFAAVCRRKKNGKAA